MFDFIPHVIHTLGLIGSGQETSPLSANSTFSELIRLVQVGMLLGVIYLITLLKQARSMGGDIHSDVQQQIASVRTIAQTNFESNRKMIEEVLKQVEKLKGGG
jgi:hypothetical protein